MVKLNKIIDNHIVIIIALFFILLIFDGVTGCRNIWQLNDKAAWVVHTEQVLTNFSELTTLIDDAESSQRGYVITGDPHYLAPYKTTLATIDAKLDHIKALTNDNLNQQARILALKDLVAAKLKEMAQPIALRRNSFDAAKQFITRNDGKKTMDAIRGAIMQMRQEELALLQERQQQSSRNYKAALATNVITTIVGLCLVAGFTYLLRRTLSERIKSSHILEEQREWYRTTLASIGDSVIATDARANVTFLNSEAEKMTGWKLHEAMGVPLYSIFHIVNEITRDPVVNPVDRVIAEGKIVGLANHTILIAKDGTERPIADTAAPIRASNGELVGVILVFHDVTDHRTLEKELKNKADMLMERDRRKDEFLAMLAHELRNPLAPISNAIHVMRSNSVSDKIREEAASLVDRQVIQMTQLLNDLLDASRVTLGKIELHRDSTSLSDVINAAVESARPLIDERRHELTIDLPEQPIWLYADATRLSQIFSNLLNNAAKYTDNGGHIAIHAFEDNGMATVHIRDNGIGIEKDMLPYIFDLFTQVNSAIDRAQGGLGIGLTLVKSLVEMHDGSITAHSDGIGHGSEFTLRFPVHHPADTPHTDNIPKPMESAVSYKALVIDDNVASAKTLGWTLELLGHSVQLAFESHEAIELAKSFMPHVILLDIGLPGMNGYEVCQALRQEPVLKNTVIIAQTGWGKKEDLARSKNAGFDYHLVKPVSMEALKNILETLATAGRFSDVQTHMLSEYKSE